MPRRDDADTEFSRIFQDLPPDIFDLARTHGAFTRARKVASPEQLLRLVFTYAALDKSLRDTAAQHTVLYEPITDSSVAERLARCEAWLRASLRAMMTVPERVAACGSRLLVIDGSLATGPGARAQQLRLHVGLELRTLDVAALEGTDVRTGERLGLLAYRPGDVVVADRNFAVAAQIAQVRSCGAEVVVRLNPASARILDRCSGTPVDWQHLLEDQPVGSLRTLAVVMESSDGAHRVECWVHAWRLEEAKAEAARRRCRRRASKAGTKKRSPTPKALTLFLCGFVLVLTTLSPGQLAGHDVVQLYGCRWQVEVVIKRMKSLLAADQLRSRLEGPLSKVWLTGKLLWVAIVHRRSQAIFGCSRLERGRRGLTPWRLWKMVAEQLRPIITGARHWSRAQMAKAKAVLGERRRKRTLQTIPPSVVALMQSAAADQLQRHVHV